MNAGTGSAALADASLVELRVNRDSAMDGNDEKLRELIANQRERWDRLDRKVPEPLGYMTNVVPIGEQFGEMLNDRELAYSWLYGDLVHADDVLRDLFKRGKYPDVILPMCVIRRMDAVIGCLDNREARLAVNRYCHWMNKPWVDGAIQEMLSVKNRPCLFDCRVATLANCFPMIPSGKAHNEMLMGEDVSDEEVGAAIGKEGKMLV